MQLLLEEHPLATGLMKAAKIWSWKMVIISHRPQKCHTMKITSPLSPGGGDSGAEMDTGMVGLLETCSGREDLKARLVRDPGEILKLVRDLGGPVPRYKKGKEQSHGGHCPRDL